MRIITNGVLLACFFILFASAIAHADSYSTFTTTRFFSTNQRYFVEVSPDKRATLYLKESSQQKIWSSTLPHLPARLFISDDGTRVVMVGFYYGDGGSASANVVLFFDETGKQTASYALGQLANMARLHQTTSSAHWYYGAFFTPDQKSFVLETLVRRCEPQTPADYENCFKTDPYEELRFSLENGELVSRTDIQKKYADREKRLLHELELVQHDTSENGMQRVYAQVRLAHYYEDQGQFAKAKEFYDIAIPAYAKVFGTDYVSVGVVVGEAAANCRKLKDYSCSETLFRQSIAALDKDQKHPDSVVPVTITVYDEYAIFLREVNRVDEATKIEKRANELRAAYPNYKRGERY